MLLNAVVLTLIIIFQDTPSWSCFSVETLIIGKEDYPDLTTQDTTIRIVLPGKPADQVCLY